jgi:anti-sigma factor (TIGR02949 family)
MPDREMSCEEVLKHLIVYLDREIDAHVAAEIEWHLKECRGCFSRAEFEGKLKSYLRDAGSISAPGRLRARIKEIIGRF